MAKQSVRAISAADVPRSRGARSSAAVQSAPENKKIGLYCPGQVTYQVQDWDFFCSVLRVSASAYEASARGGLVVQIIRLVPGSEGGSRRPISVIRPATIHRISAGAGNRWKYDAIEARKDGAEHDRVIRRRDR